MRNDLFNVSERMYVPIEQIAIPDDISIFGTHFGEKTYYADFAGIAKKYKPRSILEIGVRFGYSGIALTSGALAGGVPAPVIYVGVDAEFLATYKLYRSNAVAAENFKRFRPGVDATFYTCDTRNGLPEEVLTQRFDLINVDGDHSYEGAYGDLCRTWPLLNPGGIVIVDDIGMVDVKRAVEQFRDERSLDLEGFQWYSNERGFAIFKRGENPVAEEQLSPEAPAPADEVPGSTLSFRTGRGRSRKR